MLRFIDFVRAGVGLPSVWEGLRGQIYLGSDAFVQRMQVFMVLEAGGYGVGDGVGGGRGRL